MPSVYTKRFYFIKAELLSSRNFLYVAQGNHKTLLMYARKTLMIDKSPWSMQKYRLIYSDMTYNLGKWITAKASSAIVLHMIYVDTWFAPPSTPDFSDEVGLNLALALVTSCCGCQTARWRPACCWLGWGSMSIGDPSKSGSGAFYRLL